MTAYCVSMKDIKNRIAVIRAIVGGHSPLGREDFDGEIVCLHLRKTLEQIAFASLLAHKKVYAEVYRDFSKEWNAKRLLKKLQNVHPDFYPRPVSVSKPDEQGIRHFTEIEDGFLTEDEFVFLYNTCGGALHTRNPHKSGEHIVTFKRPIAEWVERIQRLLSTHYMRLARTKDIWVVQMANADDEKVHAFLAQDVPKEEMPAKLRGKSKK